MANTIFTKLIKKGFLLFILAVCCQLEVQATHVAAADIKMDYIGTGPTDLRYTVTLTVYKACEPNNSDLSSQERVYFYSSCYTGPQLSVLLPMTTGPDTLDQLCDNKKDSNSCRYPQSIYPGFERRVYTGEFTLPVACVDWIVNWSLCCRNQNIINLNGPGGYETYVEAGINNVANPIGSTPRFTIEPIPYICANQQDIFLNGPADPDNDSLFTANAEPWDDQNVSVPYAPPYTNANPFNSANGYTVDPNTGTAMFTPTTIAKYVMAFTVNSYEKGTGVYLGHARRDVQVSVLYCVAGPPAIDPPSNVSGGGLKGTSVV